MTYHIHVENLGAIAKADFEITPMTILAGENGTGKSFVTKFLYSVLNSMLLNTYAFYIGKNAVEIHNMLISLSKDIEEDSLLISLKEKTELLISECQNLRFDLDYRMKDEFIQSFKSDLEYFATAKYSLSQEMRDQEAIHNANIPEDLKKKILDSFLNVTAVTAQGEEVIKALENPQAYYSKYLSMEIKKQLKDNFQISELNKLIRFDETECKFSIKDSIEITLSENEIELNLHQFPSFGRLVFFESPVYWKLLPLIDRDKKYVLGIHFTNDSFTGVPQHFEDLKNLLFTNFKNGERPDFIIECANDLEQSLQGKFRPTMGNDLVFENQQGNEVDKNLVSFGMTNLGIIQAVLNKNIINKGSFIFIDEPESNLHPEWQCILADILVKLAKNGVYVVVTSHSSDILKAFEVSCENQKLNQSELSTQYFLTDGTLLSLSEDGINQTNETQSNGIAQLSLARAELLKAYHRLTIQKQGFFDD